ncbi:hypothetical protein ACFOLL_02360 [Falsochrobactrum ovis]|nr:hypothetical protein [Falsochrobactrum ovis]
MSEITVVGSTTHAGRYFQQLRKYCAHSFTPSFYKRYYTLSS